MCVVLPPRHLYGFITRYLGTVVTLPAEFILIHEMHQDYCECRLGRTWV
jgi:hypothetical protein